MFHETSNQHVCTLNKTDTTGLPALSPTSSTLRKLLRKIRKLVLLDMGNKKCGTYFRNRTAMIAERKRHAQGNVFVIHPFSKLAFILQIVFFMTWMFSISVVTIRFFVEFEYKVQIAISLVKFIQLLVVVSFFFGGFVDYEKRSICLELKIIVWRYLKLYFIFDITAILFDDIIRSIFSRNDLKMNQYSYYYAISTIVLLSYLIRIYSLMNVLHDILVELNYGDKVYFLCSRFVLTLLCLMVFVGVFATLPRLIYGDNYPQKIWLVRAKLDILEPLSERTHLDLFCECLILIASTFFGLSYAVYHITEISDYIPLMIIRMFGRFYTLYTLADFLRYFGLVGLAESKYEQNLMQIKEYMNAKNLPHELRVKVLAYFDFKMQGFFFDEKSLKNNLSEGLRNELFLYGAKRWIEKTPVFKNISSTSLANLFSQMTAETYLPNDVIFDRGVILEHVYFVAYGTVIVLNTEGLELGHLIDGDEFAVINMWTNGLSNYKVVAAETTEIYMIQRKYLLEFLSQHPTLARFYEKRATERAKKYAEAEELLKRGGTDVVAQLRGHKLLEKRNARQRLFD